MTGLLISNSIHAAVNFSRTGNDLNIDITVPIEFTLTQNYSSTSIALGIFDVLNNSSSYKQASLLPRLTYDATVSSDSLVYQGINLGAVGQDDFVILATFSSNLTVSSGQTLTVQSGLFTVSGWFTSGIQLPSSATTVQLLDPTGLTPVSNVVSAVPEPSCLSMLAGALLAGYLLRRKALNRRTG